MIRKLLYIFLIISAARCGVVKKKTTYNSERKVTVAASEPKEEPLEKEPLEKEVTAPNNSVADDIINTALSYSGVRYKYGGTTKKGMDCSGLLYVAFGEHDIQLPRISYQMAEEGRRIRVNKLVKGDLLFFKTRRGRKKINHVGMVVAIKNNEIKFIHASSSRGVIVSSLREGYWNHAFVKATRIL
ncbi:MAG: C40 family peptidase [Flavobacteriaceae bacterium]